MAGLGFSAPEVLQGSGIDEKRLPDSHYLVDAAQCKAVIANAIRLSGNPGIGFECGYQTKPSDHGVMGYAVMTCHSMRHAGELWNQYSESLVGVMSKLVLDEQDEQDEWVEMNIVRPTRIDPIFIFCVEEQLAMFYRIGRTLTGTDPVVESMEFSYPAPAHHGLYDDLFKCPIRFDAKKTSVIIGKEWLDRPLQTNDEEFNLICQKHCNWMLRQIENSSPIVSQLRNLFFGDPRAIPKLDAAARQIGLSARTLRRRLHEEEVTYHKLVDEFRRDLALEYLRSTQMSPKQIAYQLGFNDIGSFRRAFKAWSGQTIGGYRANAFDAD